MKKKLIFIFISFFLLVLPITVNATTDGFTITKYDVKMIVNENNTLNVTETISVVFDQYGKHGIKRALPTKSTYSRFVNGKNVDITQKVHYSDISVNTDYSTETSDGYKTLKIGSAYETLDINKVYTYVIKYTYDTGDDMIDEYDDLYFNIIGTEWTAKIDEVTFTIVMPKDFETSNEYGSLINFTTGKYGNAYNKGVNYKVDGKTITGYIDEKFDGVDLNEYEGLTIRLELPEGYFVNERKHVDNTLPILVGGILFVIFTGLLGIILFLKYGLRRKKTVVVQYTAPNNWDPALCGYIYDAAPTGNHIVSLITYLAVKGYLKIIDEKGNKFKLQYLKPLNGSEPEYIKTTFKGLFKKADEDGIVTKKDLTNKFYTSLNSAMSQLGKTRKIDHPKRGLSTTFNIFMAIISFGLVVIPIAADLLSYKIHTVYSGLYVLFNIVLIVNILFQLALSIASRKRTDEAEAEYALVAGYREFIDKVDVNKIKTLVEDDPELFYNVLPYAYVFGLTNKWIKKFETIKLEPPKWFEGNMYDINTGMFNYTRMMSSLNAVTASAKTTMSSRPYESSGGSGFGGGGGGGFSGGGGGGGGGSSW